MIGAEDKRSKARPSNTLPSLSDLHNLWHARTDEEIVEAGIKLGEYSPEKVRRQYGLSFSVVVSPNRKRHHTHHKVTRRVPGG